MLVLLTVVEMCRSGLFYHMTEFHNFDVGDPDNLGMIIILLINLVCRISIFPEQNITIVFVLFIEFLEHCNNRLRGVSSHVGFFTLA